LWNRNELNQKKKKIFIYIYIYIKHYQIFEKFLIEELHIQIDNPIEFKKKKNIYIYIYIYKTL